tara:strand:- start:163 stop:927 length:765 start_codon:yes stop_codon:yes gene_type:complete
MVRERNEDNFLVLPEENLFVVADGMGGHASGDVASRLCVETMRRFFVDEQVSNMSKSAWDGADWEAQGLPEGFGYEDFALYKSVEAANLAIFRAAQKNPKLKTMGTTVVSAQMVPGSFLVGYVGDSRLYRLRGDQFSLMTLDHSLANEYLRLNLIKPEDLPKFQYKNVIVRALGLAERVKVDVYRIDVQAGDRLLLCSDGLTDLVPDETIGAVLMEARNTEEAAIVLVDFANHAGGHDNTTVVVADIHEPLKAT